MKSLILKQLLSEIYASRVKRKYLVGLTVSEQVAGDICQPLTMRPLRDIYTDPPFPFTSLIPYQFH